MWAAEAALGEGMREFALGSGELSGSLISCKPSNMSQH